MTTKEKKELTNSLLDFLFSRATAEGNFYNEMLGKQFDATFRWASLEHRANILDAIHAINT